MHVHQSIWKDGQNLFAGNGYAGLSDFALYYIGGIIKHARALNAITNGHQLVQAPGSALRSPGQAGLLGPQPLGLDPYPLRRQPEGPPRRGALPGPLANPYLAFSALMMAGLDGVQNKIHRAIRPTRTCTTCRRKKTPRSRPCAPRWKKRWKPWTRTASS